MGRRRLYVPLQRPSEEPERDAPTVVADSPERSDEQASDGPHARLMALQRGAGNAATSRLLRMRADSLQLAREGEGPATPPAASSPAPPVDVAAMTRRFFEQLREESGLLHAIIVPRILDRCAAPPRVGTSESLAEITLLARDELERFLLDSAPVGAAPARPVSQVEDIQSVVVAVAKQRGIIVPGHRGPQDKGGLESEAKALANLAGLKLPDLAIEVSAGAFKFRFDGELSAAVKVGDADVSVKGGPGGVEGTVKGPGGSITAGGGPSGGRVEGRVGPLTAGGSFTKDSAKVDVKLAAGPVEFKGNISAKAGQATTWSATLEIKIGGGADPVPDPAALAKTVEAAGKNIYEAAQYVGEAVSGATPVNKEAVEKRLMPAKESIEKVAAYIEKHKSKPATSPRATIGLSAQGDKEGAVTAMLTLTITF